MNSELNRIKSINYSNLLIVDYRITDEIIYNLRLLGAECIKTVPNFNFDNAVSGHPDMLYFNSLKFIFVEYNNKLSFDKLGITDCINYSGKAIETVLFENHTYKYPCDVLLNGVEIGEKLLCNPLTIDKKIMNIYDSKNIIRVSQGYTKCNACVITNNALITEDEGIFIACRNNSIDCLKLESHSVKLDGYDYGFIGGASGKISKEIIAFCGDIDKHPEFDKIYSFCKNHGVNPISLSSDPLYDYGSIIAVGL